MNMNRLIGFILSLSILMVVPAWGATSQYGVRYVKEHLLYQDGDELNVLDIDLEWPEVVDGVDVAPLKVYLINRLFGIKGNDFDAAYAQFKGKYGQPVVQQFASLPDDRKLCNVELSLRMLGRKAGRFVSFEVHLTSKPGKASTHQAKDVTILLTFDLIDFRILQRDDLLRSSKMTRQYSSRNLMMPMVIDNEYFDLPICAAALIESKMLLLCQEKDEKDQKTLMNLLMTEEELGNYISRDAKSLLKSKKKAVATNEWQPRSEWQGEPVYSDVDERPAFILPGRQLAEYIQENLQKVNTPQDGKRHGTVTVQFVVDKTGQMQDICVVKPLAPTYDREAVHVVKSLPRWQPARKGGEEVNAFSFLEINF